MSVVTQGTQMHVPNNGVVNEVECTTSFSPDSSLADRIEGTYLGETNTRSYKKGLRTSSQATVALDVDPANDSHVMLNNLAESSDQTNLTFAIGWAGETDELMAATSGDPDAVGGLSLPDTRTWYVSQGYISDFSFDFQANTVV